MGLFAWFQRERQWRRDHVAAFSAVTQQYADNLTLFQQHAVAAVAQFVPPASFQRVAMEKGAGTYLVAPFGAQGAELYIYPNEAAIFGAKPDAWFEEWDFRAPADLLQALVKECARRAA